jgi:site-specific DNA-methyltransferase (adenine-specific)
MLQAGWLLKQCLIWVKNSLVMGRQDYQWKHEPILYGWKPGAAHEWFSDRSQTIILNFDKTRNNDLHPTMKPVKLVEYMIQNSSERGYTVMDLFGGSGTTMIACEQLDRKACLMEIDPIYCGVILDRWQDFTKQQAIRESDQKLWDEIRAE